MARSRPGRGDAPEHRQAVDDVLSMTNVIDDGLVHESSDNGDGAVLEANRTTESGRVPRLDV
jgi:hypothetical protein